MNDQIIKIYAEHEEAMKKNDQIKDISFKVPRPFHRLFHQLALNDDLMLKELMYVLVENYLNKKLSPMNVTLTRQPLKSKS